MKITMKPWGHEELLALTDTYAMKRMVINPNCRMSLQYHEKKEETIYVVSGCLSLWESKGEKAKELFPGDVYHVKPSQIHRFGATDKQVVLIECSTTELEDVVRLEDDYQR